MQLKKLVKISQVSHLHDARYGAGMGVPLLGVSLEPSVPQFVGAETFKEIRNWIVGPRWIGELDSRPLVGLTDYKLDFLQTSAPEALGELSAYELPLILKVETTDPPSWETLMQTHQERVTYFLLDPETPVDLSEDLENELLQLAARFPILLGFGINPNNIERLIESKLAGFALRGSEEEKVGYKDFDDLADVLEQLEED